MKISRGSGFWSFAKKKWLSSTCVRAGLIFLPRHYVMKNVGFILPDWYPFEEGPRRNKAAATNGAFHASVKRIIGVANSCGNHWMAFHVDMTVSPVICTLFDPQQSNSRYIALEIAVRSAVIPQLCGQPQVDFERWEKCKQQDGYSCGLWSLFFLESMISEHTWSKGCYKMEQYYRLRYLRWCLRDTESDAV